MDFSLFNVYNQIQKINVGGQIFTTTKQTLSPISIALAWDLPGFVKPMTDGDGNIFIDRDGEMFGYILNFCRHQKLILPEDFSRFELLEKEAEYYRLHTLVSEINREKSMKGMKQNQEYHYIEVVEVRIGEIENEPTRIKTRLTGRKKDILDLPSNIVDKKAAARLPDYTMLRFDGLDKRIRITEFLSNTGLSLETSDMSSSCTSYEEGGKVVMEQTFRDRWKKLHNK